MSHFTVLVRKNKETNIDDLLAPYDENLELPLHVSITKQQIIDREKKCNEEYKNTTYAEFLRDPEAYKEKHGENKGHIEYLEKEFPRVLEMTDEEIFQNEVQNYDKDRIDEKGNVWSTYNDNAKWDWWDIGGRWEGILVTKNGDKVNTCKVKDLHPTKGKICTFAAITPDGKWHEQGQMGWFGCSSETPEESEKWKKEFEEKFLRGGDPEDELVLVDCHI